MPHVNLLSIFGRAFLRQKTSLLRTQNGLLGEVSTYLFGMIGGFWINLLELYKLRKLTEYDHSLKVFEVLSPNGIWDKDYLNYVIPTKVYQKLCRDMDLNSVWN